MKNAVSILACAFFILAQHANAATNADCAEANSLVLRARDSTDETAGVALLQKAIDACPSYDAYELLGERLANFPHRVDRQRAIDAFIAADDAADSNKARAITRYRYADLLDRDEDPQHAMTVIRDAHALDPINASITALFHQIEDEVGNPTSEHLKRGLWDSMYKPLRVAATSVRVPQSVGTADRSSIDIPINFETGSVMTDQRTSDNIKTLANVLADPAHTSHQFIFVGHADARGSQTMNMMLSRKRAEAIAQAVILLEPTLRGRIQVMGKGSSEPIDPESDERAYRTNRRLQVMLK